MYLTSYYLHSISQSHDSLAGLTIFCGILSAPQSTVMAVNNVMPYNHATDLEHWSVYIQSKQAVYMFDKVFASFSLLTCKNLHKKKCTSIDTLILEIDTYCDL